MLIPFILTRMKKPHSLSCYWVDSVDFVTFSQIAIWTSQSAVFRCIFPLMLRWDYMVEVKYPTEGTTEGFPAICSDFHFQIEIRTNSKPFPTR